MTEIPPRVVYAIIAAVLVLCGMAYFKSSSTSTSTSGGCLDIGAAKPALDDAAARLDASVRAAKQGDTTKAALDLRSAAASLRTAASALIADAGISQSDMKAAEAYDKAADAYASGDETTAALYAAAAIGFVKT